MVVGQPLLAIDYIEEVNMKRFIKGRCGKGFIRGTKAVSALEYAILVGVIAVVVGAALTTFGTNITTAITKIGTNLEAKQKTLGQ